MRRDRKGGGRREREGIELVCLVTQILFSRASMTLVESRICSLLHKLVLTHTGSKKPNPTQLFTACTTFAKLYVLFQNVWLNVALPEIFVDIYCAFKNFYDIASRVNSMPLC